MSNLDDFESDLTATAPQTSDNSAPPANDFEQDLHDTAPGKKKLSLSDAAQLALERDKNESVGFSTGMGYGMGDIPASLKRVGANIYDAITGNDTTSKVAAENAKRNADFANLLQQDPSKVAALQGGRFTGQIAASAPALAAGGALAEGVASTGDVGAFLAGQSENPLLAIPSRALAGANVGAQTTALTNAGSDATPGSQLEGNMLTGGALHVGVPMAADMANGVRDMMRAPDDFATTKIMQSLSRDNFNTPDDIHNLLQSMGPNATLADAGPNTLRLARAMQSQPSEGAGAFENFLNERQEGQGSRLLEAAHGGLGTGQDFSQQMNDLIEQRAQNASPLYNQAFAANKAVSSPTIDKILSTPAGKSALADARVKMQNDMSMMGQPDAELGDQARQQGLDVPGGVAPGLNMRSLDYVKRALDDQIETAQRAGANDNARILSGMKSSLVKEMDNLDTTAADGKPGLYAQARAAYSGPSQSMEAMQNGQNFMKNDAGLNQSQLAAMSEHDKQFFRIGVAKSMQDAIENTPDGADAVKKIFGSPAKRAKLASVFPDDDSFNQFANVAQNESQFYKTRAAVLSRSQTAPGLIESQDAGMGVHDILHASTDLGGYLKSKAMNMLMGAGKMSAEKADALSPYFTDQGNALTAAGNLGRGGLSSGSYLPKYVNMLAGAYGIPATEMAAQRLSPDAPQ